jgi:hypothetical protein
MVPNHRTELKGFPLGIETKPEGRLSYMTDSALSDFIESINNRLFSRSISLKTYFEFAKHGASYKREMLAGIAHCLLLRYVCGEAVLLFWFVRRKR